MKNFKGDNSLGNLMAISFKKQLQINSPAFIGNKTIKDNASDK